MQFESKYIDELIDERALARQIKNWGLSDQIRDYLDTKLVFIFDTKDGQKVHYLTKKFFEGKAQKIETMAMSNRQYVEQRIQQDIRAENNFNAWLFSVQKSIK